MTVIPTPLMCADEPLHPVTVWLTDAQMMRLELILATARENHPAADDNALVDLIFAAGLEACQGSPK